MRSSARSTPTSSMVFDECTPYPATRDEAADVDGAVAALGRALAARMRARRQPRTRCSASCRAACYERPARRVARRARRHRLRRLRDRRARRSASRRRTMLRVLAHTAPRLPADRPRYLMGVGTPEDLVAGVGGRHRHVRLRAADAQRAQRLALHALRRRQDPQRALPRRHAAARRDLRLLHLPATSPAPTCTTCSAPTRSSARGSPRSTTCTTTSTLMGELREAIAAGALAGVRRPRSPPTARRLAEAKTGGSGAGPRV